jgi:hypothetical protein
MQGRTGLMAIWTRIGPRQSLIGRAGKENRCLALRLLGWESPRLVVQIWPRTLRGQIRAMDTHGRSVRLRAVRGRAVRRIRLLDGVCGVARIGRAILRMGVEAEWT